MHFYCNIDTLWSTKTTKTINIPTNYFECHSIPRDKYAMSFYSEQKYDDEEVTKLERVILFI